LALLDVIAQGGKYTFLMKEIVPSTAQGDLVMSVDFELNQAVKDLEFRIQIYQYAHGHFTKYRLIKLN
jgi:hypothetical protein